MSEIDQRIIEQSNIQQSSTTLKDENDTNDLSILNEFPQEINHTPLDVNHLRLITKNFLELHGGRLKKRPHDSDSSKKKHLPTTKGFSKEKRREKNLIEEGVIDYYQEKKENHYLAMLKKEIQQKFEPLRLFLQELSRDLSIGKKQNHKKIEQFVDIEDSLDRLKALTQMNIWWSGVLNRFRRNF